MKKFYSLFFLSIVINFSYAQLTLTNADNAFTFGDKFQNANMDTTGVKEGAAGANVTWDFSSINPGSTYTEDNFINPAGTAWINDFSGATLAYFGTGAKDSVFSYFKTTANSFQWMGNKAPSGNTILTDIKTIMTFPFTYNSSFNDTYSGSSSNGTIPSVYTGSISANGDGYGTLNIYGTVFNNALRVKVIDSYTNDLGFIQFNYTTTTYYWYVAGKKQPVMYIQYYQSNAGGQFPIKQKYVVVDLKILTGIKDLAVVSNVNLFPNPVKNTNAITLNYSLLKNDNISIDVVNGIGQVVLSQNNGNQATGDYTTTINLQGIPAGMYFVQLKNNSGVKTQKLIVE
jgi:hypothetical protein